jgi:hypothetical protein
MIHSKIPLLAAALGAAATFGFVWLGRSRRQALAPRPLEQLPPFDADDAARADALHDLHADSDEELDIFDVSELEPTALGDSVELQTLDEEALAVDEPYDAVDPESIGTEFLRRATEAPAPTNDRAEPPAFIEAVDIAVELPVGRTARDGSTELHAPEHAEPHVESSPNDEELAQRRAPEPADPNEKA